MAHNKLPKDVRKFASQMGVDLSGMEAEAEDMWAMLNKMSDESPAQYEQFIKQQMEDAKEGGDKEDDTVQSFRPNIGLCVQVTTTGGDGIKIRDMQSQTGKMMFINLVHHKALELPKDKNGTPVTEDRMSADGLEIPMALSPMRDLDDGSMAMDVVFHPSVIARCDTHNMFMSQVVDLCTSSITEDKGVKFARGWKLQSVKYKGGRGADKMTPVLFPINQDGQNEDRKPDKDVLNSPASLLGELMKEKSSSQEPNISIDISDEKKSGGIGSSDITASSSKVLASQGKEKVVANSNSPKKPSIKKGFLGNAKESLYPEGSTEGAGSDTGGAFARLMSRSQVVDTKTNSVSQPTAPLKQKASNEKPAEPVAEVKKDTEKELPKPDVLSVMKVDALLDSLEDGGKMFKDKKNTAVSEAPEIVNNNAIKVSGNFSADHKVNVTQTKDGEQTLLKIKVENLQELEDLSDDSADLQVSKEAVSFALKKTGKSLKITGAFALDVASTAASFSKKKKTLTVKVRIMC